MPSHPIASFIARLWPGKRTPPGPDAADLGTAFGLDMSLRDADDKEARRTLSPGCETDLASAGSTARSQRDH